MTQKEEKALVEKHTNIMLKEFPDMDSQFCKIFYTKSM